VKRWYDGDESKRADCQSEPCQALGQHAAPQRHPAHEQDPQPAEELAAGSSECQCDRLDGLPGEQSAGAVGPGEVHDRCHAAALEIADERGVSAVTMREIASRLGVEAMSLYNHVANKDDIMDGMVDAVIEQFDLPEGVESWREAMRRRAISAHEVFGRHPWVPLLLDSRESSGPARLRY
jgi:hypothetical protein